jgi:hypothetical protein
MAIPLLAKELIGAVPSMTMSRASKATLLLLDNR